jgi:transcription elongation factor Elf1
VKVTDDKKTSWSKTITCPDCKSTLEIVADDVHVERLGSFDEFSNYYIATCGACGTGVDVGSKVPDWVRRQAKST